MMKVERFCDRSIEQSLSWNVVFPSNDNTYMLYMYYSLIFQGCWNRDGRGGFRPNNFAIQWSNLKEIKNWNLRSFNFIVYTVKRGVYMYMFLACFDNEQWH